VSTVDLKCLCVTGPTGAGKTDLVLRLAEDWPLEVISMDSAMVYRGMDIGTAKPSPAVRGRVPHHLIDILDPAQSYSAGRFRSDALEAIGAVQARGRIPVVTGGTLLYLRALTGGLADIPDADPEVRAAIDEQAAVSGWPAMHARLAEVDPVAAARIAPADRQRIQRALEVWELTGQPLSSLQARRPGPSPVNVQAFALIPSDRNALAVGIARRFDAMMDAGLLAEVRALWSRGDLTADTPAVRAVGYRQLWAHLAGACDLEIAREQAIVATRRLAKRQLTWLRGEPWIRNLVSVPDAREQVAAQGILTEVLRDWA
jgi:tRNA dimethylallyltransferase